MKTLKKIYPIASSVVGIILIFLLICMFVFHLDFKGGLDSALYNYSVGWKYSDGSDADLMKIKFNDDSAQLYRYVTASEASGLSLCFISRNVDFNIYLNDELIYDFNPEMPKLYGQFYGDFVHTAKVPNFEGMGIIRIDCECLTYNKWTGFDGMVLQDSGRYLLNNFRSSSGKFLICLITFFFGFILFVLGVVEQPLRGNMVETLSLGVMTMVLSVWSAPQASILQIITGNCAVSRVLDYATLALIPVPILIFVDSLTRFKNKRLLNIFLTASAANMILNLVLVGSGKFDYRDMLAFSHIMILFGVVLIIFMIADAVRKHRIDKIQRRYLIISHSVIIFAGLVDMFRYYFGRAEDTAAVSRLGLLVFVTILTSYEIRHFMDMQVSVAQAEVVRKMALEDALTGLANRAAFNEYEKELLGRDSGRVIFVHLDVNRLKAVNDSFGHAEGDKHIIAAAEAIKNSFGEYGSCYRVGGDEFFAVLEGKNAQTDYERALKKFSQLQDEYNAENKPQVGLEIAYGKADYECREKNPEMAERLADSRMYEKKKLMKNK